MIRIPRNKKRNELINTVKGKLRKTAGASLIFALVILLICTVISSVVLTAATSAAGRVASATSTDRRYYAVRSAVELIDKNFSGYECSYRWTRVSETPGTSTVDVGVEMDSTYSEKLQNSVSAYQLQKLENGETYSVYFRNKTIDSIKEILDNYTLDSILGSNRAKDNFSEDNAWANKLTFDESDLTTTYNLKMEGTGSESKNYVNVTISMKLEVKTNITTQEKSYKLIVVVQSDTSDGENPYSTQMVFYPSVSDTTVTISQNDEKTSVQNKTIDPKTLREQYTQDFVRTKVEERNIKFKWTLKSVTDVY